MKKNYFKIIRRSYFFSTLCTTLLCNIMVFGQPIVEMACVAKSNTVGAGYPTEYSTNKSTHTENPEGQKPAIVLKNWNSAEPEKSSGEKEKHKTTIKKVFSAKENHGIIGIHSDSDRENPLDNFFTVHLPDSLNLGLYDAILAYDLYGLKNASHTTKSINDFPSYGGRIIVKDEGWNEVEEFISTKNLKNGENIIFFTRRVDKNYRYEVRNIRIKLLKKKNTNIQVTTDYLANVEGTVYITGFVTNPAISSISILGKTITINNGVFEYLIKDIPRETKTIAIHFETTDGKHSSKTYKLKFQSTNALIDYFNPVFETVSQTFLLTGGTASERINFHNLALEVDEIPRQTEKGFSIAGLTFKDIRPLNPEIVNVTSGKFGAYRIARINFPDSIPVSLRLGYDPKKIPEGYTAKDVRTFYFDRKRKTWKSLPVDTLDYGRKMIVSALGPETDYINGVIKVPGTPETASFAPTDIVDMKYADPAAGLVAIPPPTPNNTGSTSTYFPIKLPPGRNGMQPSLNITYNSDAGNGWMGVGWNLTTPAITLNTKWGVPRFEPNKESEVYSLNGADLVLKAGSIYTNPHRKWGISRPTANTRRFYLRKEGSYLKIIRHGDNPNNYWWEVTDKKGNKSYYGGYPDTGVNNNAVIRTPEGNIAHWGLVRREDSYGNSVEYQYDKGTVLIGSTISATYFYIDKIRYTRHNNANNYYEVAFKRNAYTVSEDGNTTFTAREDKILNGRKGFLQLTDDLLTEIQVSLVENGQPQRIRTYRFDYGEMPFKKRQLVKISEFDTEGLLFYSNTMEYFNDIQDNNAITSGSSNTWTADSGGNDNISSPLHNLPGANDLVIPNGSPLYTSVSSGFSIGLRAGFGIGKNVFSVKNTIGGSFNYSKSNQSGRISLMDINGDGLPDKITQNSSGVFYRPNTGEGFGSMSLIQGISEIDETRSRTTGFGFDANVGGIVGVGTSWSKTKSDTDSYFVDFNGDGLPDMANEGKMLFNVSNGSPENRKFTTAVGQSENRINPGTINPGLVDNLRLETLDELREQHSQYDHVKVWEAPYTGKIDIEGMAEFVEKNENESDNNFRITIERTPTSSGSTANQIFSNVLQDTGQAINTVKYDVNVDKGDLFFFRIHNLDHGSGGIVEWNPEISYQQAPVPPHIDENGKPVRDFNAQDDFILNNGSGYNPGSENSFTINYNLPNFSPFQFTDNIDFVVRQIRVNLNNNTQQVQQTWKRTYDHKTGGISGSGSIPIYLSTPQGYKDVFYFEVLSTSNLAWNQINWTPTIAVSGETEYPAVNYKTFDENVNQSQYWNQQPLPQPVIYEPEVDGHDPFIIMQHNLFNQDYSYLDNLGNGEFPLKINWVVKQRKQNGPVGVLYKRTFYLYRFPDFPVNNYIFSQSSTSLISTTSDDEHFILTKNQVAETQNLYAAFYIENRDLALNPNASIVLETLPPYYPGWHLIFNSPFFSVSPKFYGISYRGWGQLLYNGGIVLERDPDTNEIVLDASGNPIVEEDFGDEPIDISVFNFEDEAGAVEDIDPDIDPEDVEDNVQGLDKTSRFTFYGQDNENNRYVNEAIKDAIYGFDNADLQVTLGRFGEGNLYNVYIDPEDIIQNNDHTFIALKQRTESKGSAVSGSLTFPSGASGSGTHSKATTDILNQYVDLNGDRYPDIVTDGKIQFTNGRGGLSYIMIPNNFVAGNKNVDESIGASVASNKPNSTGSSNGSVSNKTNANTNSGITYGPGKSFESRQWMDMNGDGLPDKVLITKTSVEVRLNTGYGFADENEKLIWIDGLDLVTSKRDKASIGPAIQITESFAVGMGASLAKANINATLIDVNGDGLPDLVVKTGGQHKYYLNKGTGFETTSKLFRNHSKINENSTLSGNVFGSVTFGFPIPIPVPPFFLKVVFSPSAGASANFNEQRFAVRDINGDGLPDVLRKANNTNNSTIKANLNQVGKTHLLRKINLPLGGSWEIKYERSENSYAMPQSKWLLTEIKTYDGFTGDSAYGPDESLFAVSYENGQYDRRERDFLGYEKVKTEEKDPATGTTYRYTEALYHNDNYYLKGALEAISSYTGSGQLLSKTETLYNLLNPDNPVINFAADSTNHYLQAGLIPNADALLDQSRLFVAVAKTTKTGYENGSSLSSSELYMEYDEFGNLLKFIGGGPNDYRTEITYYSAISGVENSTGFPKTIEVFDNSTNQLMRKREALYNGKGSLRKVTTKLNNNEVNQISFWYDAYGNRRAVNYLNSRDSLGNYFRQNINYDQVVHTYPVKLKDSFNQESTAVYNYLFGTQVLVTDMNGQSMRTRIDNRGRIVEVTNPHNYPGGWTLRMEYEGEPLVESAVSGLGPNEYLINAQGSFPAIDAGTMTPPTNAQHYAVTRHSYMDGFLYDQLLTISIVDGLGKALQMKKSHYSNIRKWLVSGKEVKDPFGRIIEVYLPTTQAYPSNPSDLDSLSVADLEYDVTLSPAPPLEMAYDEKNRKTSIKQPGESLMTQLKYGIDGNFFTRETTNELGQVEKVYTDVRGRKRRTVQNKNITTHFYYNAVNERTQVTNDAGYSTQYKYDLAGRLVEKRHPDRGVETYTYNKAGNLTHKQTGTGDVGYVYNFNRLVEIHYPQNPLKHVKYVYGKPGDPLAENRNAVGRLLFQEDASGIQVFGYGKRGELISRTRSVAVAGYHSFWFQTQWEYDNWGRIKEILYPDREIVRYDYGPAGRLYSIGTSAPVMNGWDIVDRITYNDYGERTQIEYGNGVVTNYQYDTRRRLKNLEHLFTNFQIENQYAYDELSNIVSIHTLNPNTSLPSVGQIGGPATHTFHYDGYNRLVHAEGSYTGPNDAGVFLRQEYELKMRYDNSHNIVLKEQEHFQGAAPDHSTPMQGVIPVLKTSYRLEYGDYASGNFSSGSYNYVQPHAPRSITENPSSSCCGPGDPRVKSQSIDYDANGNMSLVSQTVGKTTYPLREYLWDAENRLLAVDLDPGQERSHPIAVYTYDAGGQRIIKYNRDYLNVTSNNANTSRNWRDDITVYPSGLLTGKLIPPQGELEGEGGQAMMGQLSEEPRDKIMTYTKHYYIGSERVASAIGTAVNLGHLSELVWGAYPNLKAIGHEGATAATEAFRETYVRLGQTAIIQDPSLMEGEFYLPQFEYNPDRYDAYWYHPDHLGSSNYISNLHGNVSQHMEYLPFGETLVEEHLNSYNSPYKFNAKELDAETGNYYYGARYYNPKWSIWLSVDPLADKFPGWSPYNYTFQNPVRFVDPDGNSPACTTCPWPSSLKSFGNFGNQLVDKINSGLKSIGDGAKSIGRALATPFVMISNYLKESGGGFNFYSKSGGGGNPGRKGGRDTQMVNADGIMQAAGFAKTGKMLGPRRNPKDYKESFNNILIIGGNTADGTEIGGDIMEKFKTITTTRAIGIEKIGENTKIGHRETVEITVPVSKVDSVIRTDSESIRKQNKAMNIE